MAISGLVITFNEEANIERCVREMFEVCNEVIVVDSLSKDKTVEIAESLGAKVVLQPFLGDGPQRSFGIPLCQNDWVLNLDCDEYLDAEAKDFLKTGKYLEGGYDAFSFRVKNFFQDKWISFAGWYPDEKVRFFNRVTAKSSGDIFHQEIKANKKKKLKCHILHYGSHSFLQILDKKNKYAVGSAKMLFDKGKKVNAFKPILNGTVSFIRCYFFKKGIINGIDGLTFSLTQAYFSYMKYANLIQMHKEAKKKV